jgi:hypothetical protein
LGCAFPDFVPLSPLGLYDGRASEHRIMTAEEESETVECMGGTLRRCVNELKAA